jgi:hypothetical protein
MIEAMKLALEALEHAAECVQNNSCPAEMGHDWDKQIQSLRNAIAEAEKQETVNRGDAVEWLCHRCKCIHPRQRHGFIQPCPDCNEVMAPTSFNLREIDRLRVLLTTTPKHTPLTDEMTKQMKERCDSMEMRGAFADGWLSAEAAHGIKGEA